MAGKDHEKMDLNESKVGLSSCIKSRGFPSSFKTSNFKRKQEISLLKLHRIRDSASLLLSYPMRTVHDSKLKTWIHQVSDVHASIGEKNKENPLHCLEGMVPVEMMMEAGSSSMFDHSGYKTPDAILNLAADLAVDQLVQTLLSRDDHARNIHQVMISTRNNDESREVFEKMKVVLKDMENMPCFNESFHGVFWVDVSTYQSQVRVEVLVEQQIHLQLQLQKLKQSNLQGMISKKYLVLVLEGNAEKTMDMRKVNVLACMCKVVMVLITTETQKQADDEKIMAMDLTISSKGHLLPWKLFCQNVGNKLVYSSSAIQKIAIRLVQECGGHLLAIVLVAKSLKNMEDVIL